LSREGRVLEGGFIPWFVGVSKKKKKREEKKEIKDR
jgi:hypothetical protein